VKTRETVAQCMVLGHVWSNGNWT